MRFSQNAICCCGACCFFFLTTSNHLIQPLTTMLLQLLLFQHSSAHPTLRAFGTPRLARSLGNSVFNAGLGRVCLRGRGARLRTERAMAGGIGSHRLRAQSLNSGRSCHSSTLGVILLMNFLNLLIYFTLDKPPFNQFEFINEPWTKACDQSETIPDVRENVYQDLPVGYRMCVHTLPSRRNLGGRRTPKVCVERSFWDDWNIGIFQKLRDVTRHTVRFKSLFELH